MRIHPGIFNDAFASYFLAPVKDLVAMLMAVSIFALIKYAGILDFVSKLLLAFIGGGMVIVNFVIFYQAGFIYKYSKELKHKINLENHIYILRKRQISLQPFGIQIGSFYVMESYSFLSLFDIILQAICTLLIVFKN